MGWVGDQGAASETVDDANHSLVDSCVFTNNFCTQTEFLESLPALWPRDDYTDTSLELPAGGDSQRRHRSSCKPFEDGGGIPSWGKVPMNSGLSLTVCADFVKCCGDISLTCDWQDA